MAFFDVVKSRVEVSGAEESGVVGQKKEMESALNFDECGFWIFLNFGYFCF